MSATPKDSKQNRYEQFIAQDENHSAVDLPPIDFAWHIIGYLQEMGYCSSQGFGPSPLSFTEISAWQRVTDTPLSHWEATAMRYLSSEYVRKLKASESHTEPPVYLGDIESRRKETHNFFKKLVVKHNDRHRNTKRKGHHERNPGSQ